MHRPPNRRLENCLQTQGYSVVAGVDEVGRGSLAGPVVAAAVVLPARTKLTGVKDSKLLSHQQRLKLDPQIKSQAIAIGIGWVGAAEISQFGLTWAVCQSGLRALADLNHPYDAVILDGNHNYLKEHCFAQAVIKADQTCLSVACASVVAKVARDRYMAQQHKLFPRFSFHTHKGYFTAVHRAALDQEGVSPIHRLNFLPVRQLKLQMDVD